MNLNKKSIESHGNEDELLFMKRRRRSEVEYDLEELDQ